MWNKFNGTVYFTPIPSNRGIILNYVLYMYQSASSSMFSWSFHHMNPFLPDIARKKKEKKEDISVHIEITMSN